MSEHNPHIDDREAVGPLQRDELSDDEAHALALRVAALGVSDEALLTLVDEGEIEDIRREAGLSADEVAAA